MDDYPPIGMRGTGDRCPCCGAERHAPFVLAEGVPVQNTTLFKDASSAREVRTGNMDLRVCEACGFIFNVAFDPSQLLYSQDYEETQGYSKTFQAFHREVADDLVRRFDLHKKRILEIGCGKGEFLALLCENGRNRGIGIDPAFRFDRHPDPDNSQLEFHDRFFREGDRIGEVDLVCCKMTLEHIPDVHGFLKAIVDGLGSQQAQLFFQIPEMGRILRETAFWDVYYEHCSYFTPDCLRFLFRRCGLEVEDVWTAYDDQYLMITAQWHGRPLAVPDGPDYSIASHLRWVERFRDSLERLRHNWSQHLSSLRSSNGRFVIWGGSSKTVAFLSFIPLDNVVRAVVDINPNKQGTYIAGSGLPILSPAELKRLNPDEILIMNPVYTEEIRLELEKLGLFPELIRITRWN